MKELVVVTGPTAVGKTSEAISLAKHLNTEIISADSRQFYKELNIGVARPSKEELAEVKHHFIAHISIQDPYSAGTYEADAIKKIEELFEKHDKLVLTGGSGMYIDAIIKGIDNIPEVPKHFREELNQDLKEKGIEHLQNELKILDPEYYDIVDKHNHIRLIRALEVIRYSNQSFTSFRKNRKKERSFEITQYALHRNREELIERIDKRVEIMIGEGLLEEALSVHPYKHLPALNTVGYKELFEYFDKKTSLEQAIERIKTNTRRYAKRQMTWFRKDENYKWLNLSQGIDWKEV